MLALLDTSAHQAVSMSNFNVLPRPGTVLVTGNQAAVIRCAEMEADVFRRNVVAQHLRRTESAAIEAAAAQSRQ